MTRHRSSEAVSTISIPSSDVNASISTNLRGIWEGTITADPDYHNSQFTAMLTIIDGNIGEIVGITSHPSIECGGHMRLQNATEDSVIVSSDYTFGPCLDGTHHLDLLPDGRLSYAWHDPNSDRVDRGALTLTGGVGTALPSTMVGIWEGDINGLTTQMALSGGESRRFVGTTQHPSDHCGARITLRSVEENSITADANYFYGPCTDGGTYELTLLDDDTLNYLWRSPNGRGENEGILNRISTDPTQACLLDDFGDASGNAFRQDQGVNCDSYGGTYTVIDFRQNQDVWSCDNYGGTYAVIDGEERWLPFIWYGEGQDTIAAWGCFLTSAAMIVNYYADQQGVDFETDPGALNRWLQRNSGYSVGARLPPKDPTYVNGSLVLPSKVAEYAQANGIKMRWLGSDKPNAETGETDQAFMARTRATVTASMCNGDPMILGVTTTSQHFVAASGAQTVENTPTWRIHDPLRTQSTTLHAQYDNEYNRTVRFDDGPADRSLSVVVYPPSTGVRAGATSSADIYLMLTDPEGRRTGYDAETETSFREIPGACYGLETLAASGADGATIAAMVLNVTAAVLGDYQLQIGGSASGDYNVEILAVDNTGTGHLQSDTTAVRAGRTNLYDMDYNGTPDAPISVDPVPVDEEWRVHLPIIRLR